VANNIGIGGSAGNESSAVRNNDKLQDFNNRGDFIEVDRAGEQGVFNTLILFARDLKNIFYTIAVIYFLVIILRLILSNNTEEELGKFKGGIIWITIGLIVMQIAFVFAQLLFDQGVSARLGVRLIDNLIWPLVTLLQTLASLFFIAIAIFAFYRLVTANGNEEAQKSGKMTIAYALIGFIIIRFARGLVEAFYGRVSCEDFSFGFVVIEGTCRNVQDISEATDIVITILNWINGFIAIVVLLMIIYAGTQILLSGGDEERIKKGKNSILYIAIGLFLLAANYLILTFFLLPESTI
jgi:uncharacterized membrane protein